MEYLKYSGTYKSEKLRAGTSYPWFLWIPENAEVPLAVFVSHDGLNEPQALAMAELAETGEAPRCAVIGISPGTAEPSLSGGFPRNMRFSDYDVFDSGYMDFVVDEFIPFLREKFDLNLSDDPDLHMVTGGSSGGISSWNGVWFRNDYFRRTYICSPTFSAMARGNVAPVWMRLCETKPVRVYIDYSENEPDDYFGSSLCAAMEAHYALRFAGYDYNWAFYPGEGHSSRYWNRDTAKEVFRWLWKDWKTEPIRAPRMSPRVDAVVDRNEPWRETDRFPAPVEARTAHGVYRIRDTAVVLESPEGERVAADGFAALSGAALSSDKWILYIADSSRACIYEAAVGEDGSLSGLKRFASLQTATDFRTPGAAGICVDSRDRIYAATELGIQCVRSYGLVDAILPLPGNAVPRAVRMEGEMLYADCGDRIYVRRMKAAQAEESPTRPRFDSYYAAADEG